MPKAKPRAIKGRSSRFKYVHWLSVRSYWVAEVRRGDRVMRIGAFEREVDAGRAADRLVLHLDGKRARLNFPKAKTRPASLEELHAEIRGARKRATASKYVGVRLDANGTERAWAASLNLPARRLSLGRYKTEREAAVAHDRAVLFYKPMRARLNFPGRRLEPASAEQLSTELRASVRRHRGATARGVTWNGYSFFARYRGRHLGSFKTEVEAARAYDAAAGLRRRP